MHTPFLAQPLARSMLRFYITKLHCILENKDKNKWIFFPSLTHD